MPVERLADRDLDVPGHLRLAGPDQVLPGAVPRAARRHGGRLPDATWNVPDGGFYTWVRLPDGLDAKDMLPRAVTARVAYVPGTAFYFDGSGADHMRLSFCYPTPERIREGVRRLAGVVAGERELVELFGTTGSAGQRDVQSPAPDAL